MSAHRTGRCDFDVPPTGGDDLSAGALRPTDEEIEQGHRDMVDALHPPRIKPTNEKAEEVLLGALLRAGSDVTLPDLLKPEHFADPIHGLIYGRIVERVRAGLTPRALVDKVAAGGDPALEAELMEVGGTPYLHQLRRNVEACSTEVSLDNYAQSILDAYLRRRLIDVADRIVSIGKGAASVAFGDGENCDSGPRQALALTNHLLFLVAEAQAIAFAGTP